MFEVRVRCCRFVYTCRRLIDLSWLQGRLLHGTGVNTTDKPRRMFVANALKPSFRQQEIWTLSLAPDVVRTQEIYQPLACIYT